MRAEAMLQLAHWGMLAGLVLCLAAIALAYGYHTHLSLGGQVAAHMSLIPSATLFKFSYIARLVALKRLGRPVN